MTKNEENAMNEMSDLWWEDVSDNEEEDTLQGKKKEGTLSNKKTGEEICKSYLDNGTCRTHKCPKIHMTWSQYKKTIRCKYDESGKCFKGKRCEYQHKFNIPCFFHKLGKCRNQEHCEYNHEVEEETFLDYQKVEKITNLTIQQHLKPIEVAIAEINNKMKNQK